MKILITSGPTIEPIDDVRHIGNMSSGRFGSAIALQALKNLNSVVFYYGKGSKSPHIVEVDTFNNFYDTAATAVQTAKIFSTIKPFAYKPITFKTFDEYRQGVIRLAEEGNPDVIMLCAAVSDYGPEKVEGKISSSNPIDIHLEPNPKVLDEIREKFPSKFIVSFKLLVNSTHEQLVEAMMKQIERGADCSIGNDLSEIRNGVHRVTIMDKEYDYSTFSEKEYDLSEVIMKRVKILWTQRELYKMKSNINKPFSF